MNADFRVDEIFTDEETGDVIALCYDVLYGETFEKFLGQGDDYDGKENASNLLNDSNYEISDEIRADIEDIFGVKEFDDENGYADSYQFYDFGDDDFEEEEVAMATESFSLREALNKIDWNTDNKYDLLNLYEACDLSENEKRALANIVYDQNDPGVIYDTLNDRYVSGEEIEMPERVKDGVIHEDVDNLSEEEIYDRVVNYLENHPYDFDRDRLDVEDICDEIAANLFGVDYFNVDGKVSYTIFNAVNNYFEELDELTEEDDLGDDELNAFYKGYTEEDKDENSAYNKLKKNVKSIEEDLEDIEFIVDTYLPDLLVGDTDKPGKYEMCYRGNDSVSVIVEFDPSYSEYVFTIDGEGPHSYGSYEYIQGEIERALDKKLQKNESKSMNESDEETPYTKEQIERDLKSITHNFTDKEGELKCGFEEEKNFGVEILNKYYKVVETSGDDRRDGTWYHISFAEPIEK